MADATLRCLRSPFDIHPALEESLVSVIPPEYMADDFSLREWLADEDANNYLYYDPTTRRDFAMFEYLRYESNFEGHQWFGSHRGRAGINFGKKVLEAFFEAVPQAVIKGWTPLENEPARWMARKLGFVSLGVDYGIERFFLTADRFRGIM